MAFLAIALWVSSLLLDSLGGDSLRIPLIWPKLSISLDGEVTEGLSFLGEGVDSTLSCEDFAAGLVPLTNDIPLPVPHIV